MRDGIMTEYKSEGVNFPPRLWLPEDEYFRACQSFIRVCADVFLVDREKKGIIYLARRVILMEGWMGFGGAVNPGEGFNEAGVRILKQDTGLEVPAESLCFLRWARYIYQDSMSRPQDAIALQFSCEVESGQVNDIQLDPREYSVESGVQSFDRSSLDQRREELHPGVEDIFNLIFHD